MADNQKQSNFISRARQLATQYRDLVAELAQLDNEWGALYSGIVTEDDFDGSNLAVIPSGDPATRLTSLTEAIANMQSIVSTFNAGIDTNFERVTV